MLRLRSFVYAVKGWCHHLKGEHFRKVSNLVSFLAREDAKRTGKIIEITTNGHLETYFPCGCQMYLYPGLDDKKLGIKALTKRPCNAHYRLKFFGSLR